MTAASRLPRFEPRPTRGRAERRRQRMGASTRSFDEPNETKSFPNGRAHIVGVPGVRVGMGTFRPGWRWWNAVRALMARGGCPLLRVGYQVSGRRRVEPGDGST